MARSEPRSDRWPSPVAVRASGRAIARAFAEPGDLVHVGDISAAPGRRGRPTSCPPIGRRSTPRARRHRHRRCRGLRPGGRRRPGTTACGVFVNCAGVFDGYAGIDETSPELWRADHRRQPDGLLPRLQGRRRRARPPVAAGGSSTIGSVAGRHGGADGLAYAASKAGIEGMTRRLAIDVGRQSITANVIAPGVITHRHPRQLGGGARRSRRRQPGCRHVERQDGLADPRRADRADPTKWPPTALFLASDAAAYVTGQVVCTSTAAGTPPECRLQLPHGQAAGRVDRRRLRRPLPLDGHVRAHVARLPVAGRVRRRGRRAPAARSCSTRYDIRTTWCTPSHTLRTFPAQCARDRRAPATRSPPTAATTSRCPSSTPPRSAGCWSCRSPSTSSSSVGRPTGYRSPGVGLLRRHPRPARGVRVRVGLVADGPRLRGLPSAAGRHRRPRARATRSAPPSPIIEIPVSWFLDDFPALEHLPRSGGDGLDRHPVRPVEGPLRLRLRARARVASSPSPCTPRRSPGRMPS